MQSGLSKSGFYAYLKRKAVDEDQPSKEVIRATFERYEGIYGYRQIQLFMYQDHHVWMNHKKILRLIHEMGLQAKIRRKFRHHRAWSLGDRVVRNVLDRHFEAHAPNQKWVTDVTQYRVKDSWLGWANRSQRSGIPVHVLRLPRHAAKGWCPKSACLAEAIVTTMPPWRASSPI
ncbi:IS3 family transposase [Paenibacillus sp. P22]|uniref:IS3 family transposase n=1 Tax=Paenibacillus sp. P22 TaxID=483908 RepID=UPI0004318B4A|nr:hypothetical protein BN871_EL_00060 [Paenibacillus sp. P22]